MAELNGVTKGLSVLIQKFYTDEFIRLSQENARLRGKLDTIFNLENWRQVGDIGDCYICDKIFLGCWFTFTCKSCNKQYCNRHTVCPKCEKTDCDHLLICSQCNKIFHYKTLCGLHQDEKINNKFICKQCIFRDCGGVGVCRRFVMKCNMCQNPHCELYKKLIDDVI